MPAKASTGAVMRGGLAGVSVHGDTQANYNGGVTSIVGQKAKKSEDCGGCPPGQTCVHVTGTRVSNYNAAVTIKMPSVPSGLSACEAAAVRKFINTTLRAHELDHKKRFETYNGTTRVPFDLTGCGMGSITEQLNDIHMAEADERKDAAEAKSAEIDPFTEPIPSDCPDTDS